MGNIDGYFLEHNLKSRNPPLPLHTRRFCVRILGTEEGGASEALCDRMAVPRFLLSDVRVRRACMVDISDTL